jgi:hypothetical protein
MATFQCSTCGYSKSTPEEWVGKLAICPKCSQKSRIQPESIKISDAECFDESTTFAYKGDYLGMPLSKFLHRHPDIRNPEFKLISSNECPLEHYDYHGFESWMHKTDRLIQYSATGSRLTIVGFPLLHGVFIFLNNCLCAISLSVANPTYNTYNNIMKELYKSLDDRSSTESDELISVTTWNRPLGEMSLVYLSFEPAINVRYVNKETLKLFNAIRIKATGSRDL